MPLLALPNEVLIEISGYLRQLPTCYCKCQCHQISRDISAFSRSNHHLHALLSGYLLATASASDILFWAIANSRPDTVAFALERGADPNTFQNPPSHVNTMTLICTPVELAISLRELSVDAESHAHKLATLILLLDSGGICEMRYLDMPTRCGDLDLLTLCLSRLDEGDDENRRDDRMELLRLAVGHCFIDATKLVIGGRATVDSVGAHNHPEYYPPLWVCWRARLISRHVLAKAGADPTSEPYFDALAVENMGPWLRPTPEIDGQIALLVRYGAVDQRVVGDLVRARDRDQSIREPPGMEYRGWVPSVGGDPIHWPLMWELAEGAEECYCQIFFR